MIIFLCLSARFLICFKRFILICVYSLGASSAFADPIYGVAGIPQDQAKTRDYDKIFERLASSGVDAFFPTFLYQQHPSAKSLGFEKDFGPDCSPDQPSFYFLRKHGLKLLLSADSLYSPARLLPSMQDDPLRAVIACAGLENILGVLSYDEPAHTGVSAKAASALYDRVKAVAPGMAVYMVHAPLTLGAPAQDAYLEKVREISKFADVVGFDIYPVTNSIAKVVDPEAPGNVLLGANAVSAYMTLIRDLAPNKRYLAVLQNFAYADQFSADALRDFPPDLVEKERAGPTRADTLAMARAALAGGAEAVAWFGGSYTPTSTAPQWKATISVIELLAGEE